jgi:hypothetical protein
LEPNFIIVPQPDALRVLWQAFPELQGELDDGTDFGPYYTYARFAEFLVAHREERELWDRAYGFFESLAASGSNLEDILVVALFEPLSDHRIVAERLKNNLGPRSLKLLIESQTGSER